MFECVMGLFFFFFFSALVMRSDSKDKKYKQEMQSYSDGKNNFKEQVVDRRLQYAVRGSEQKVAEKEADEALLEMFKTPDRVAQFKKNYQSRDGGYSERIYMAKRGKLLEFDAMYGIWFDCVGSRRYDISVEECDQFARDCRTFVFWIDRQLKRHGVSETLYFGRDGHYFCPAYASDWNFGNTYQWGPSILEGLKVSSQSEMIRKTKEKHPTVYR
jgi:hypothetical protein